MQPGLNDASTIARLLGSNSSEDTLLDDFWGWGARRTRWDLASIRDEERQRLDGVGGGLDLLDVFGRVHAADNHDRYVGCAILKELWGLGKCCFGGGTNVQDCCGWEGFQIN